MVNRRKIREAIGWTHQTALADPSAWRKAASDFHEAAVVLYKHEGHFTLVFAFNAGLSLELALKAILAARGTKVPATHKIRELAAIARINIEKEQVDTLDIFTSIVEWRGRYPAPTKESKWNDFHDIDMERVTIRKQDGNVHKTMADPKRFPTLENYIKLWETCDTEFRKVAPYAGFHGRSSTKPNSVR